MIQPCVVCQQRWEWGGVPCRIRSESNNRYRLMRVLEILLTTGKTLAELNHDRTAALDYDFRCFFLNRPRLELYDRIGVRCEQMIVNGLLRVCQFFYTISAACLPMAMKVLGQEPPHAAHMSDAVFKHRGTASLHDLMAMKGWRHACCLLEKIREAHSIAYPEQASSAHHETDAGEQGEQTSLIGNAITTFTLLLSTA